MILQDRLPYDPMNPRPLPGIAPLAMADWLIVDEAYAGQMAERRRIVATHGPDALARAGSWPEVETEALEVVLDNLPGGFSRDQDLVTCPDGRVVDVTSDRPLEVLNQIIQEDICLMVKPKGADEHELVAACLCFPASWRLQEKIGKPLVPIHARITPYTDNIAARVQRLFNGIQPGRPLWRFNALWYEDPTLYQPRSVTAPREIPDRDQISYLRSERQSLVRLPRTGGVIFSIHTYVIPADRFLTS